MKINQIHPTENIERYIFEELLGIRAAEKYMAESLASVPQQQNPVEILPNQLAALRERLDSLEWLLETVETDTGALPLAA